MGTNSLVQRCNQILGQREDMPGAPVWHMGKVAILDSKESFDLLQNSIDYLSCKAQLNKPFSSDEKEFMKEIFEALWWGGQYKGFKMDGNLGIRNRLMRIFIITILLLSAIAYSGCSSKNDCLTSDTIEQLKVFDEHNTKYSLFLRVSGLQEKEAFYELYKGVPVFDNCGISNIQAVSTIHIDKQHGTVSKLTIDGGRLDLLYSGGDNSSTKFKDVNVEIKER